MSQQVYKWKRFWCPRSGSINLLDNGYLYDPETKWGNAFNPDLVSLEGISHFRCLVLLGEPGIGKTETLKTEKDEIFDSIRKQGNEPIFFDLRSYGSEDRLIRELFDSLAVRSWIEGGHQLYIFLDSLDECLLRVETVAALLVDKIRGFPDASERMHLRVNCRTSVWQRVQPILEEGLKDIWDEKTFGVYELAPLRRVDVIEAAIAENILPEPFLKEVRQKDGVPLAIKPVTLKFLLNTYRRNNETFPVDQTIFNVYLSGCRLLCEETNKSRRGSGRTGRLDVSQRLSLAMRVAALTVFSNKFSVWTAIDHGDVPSEDISIQQLCHGYEYADGKRFEITRSGIEEVLDTGLFSSRGLHRMGWAHQTYAEFLAALYLVQSEIPLEKIVGIIFAHSQGGCKLVPQLHETSAWLASMRSDVLQEIVQTDPNVLLRSDLPTDVSIRASIVDTLLRQYEQEELFDRERRNYHNYSRLSHPGLAQQLRPFIGDITKQIDSRDLAIDIAEVCQVTELQEDIVSLALNPSQPILLRVSAANAISAIGDSSTRMLLKPLVAGPLQEDEDDQLRGYVLQALWPEHITVQELFSFLSVPKKRNFLGSYEVFIQLNILPNLTSEDIAIAVDWVSKQGLRCFGHSFEEFCDEILMKGWQKFEESNVAESFVRVALVQWKEYQDIITHDGKLAEQLASSLRNSQKRRRTLTVKAVRIVSLTEDNPSYLTGSLSQYVLLSEDCGWLVEEIQSSENEKAQRIWAQLIRQCFNFQNLEQIDIIVTVAQSNRILRSALSVYLDPIELESERAERAKSYHIGGREKHSLPVLTPSPQERVINLLEKLENGDLAAWWQLNMAMTLKPEYKRYTNESVLELVKLPGWMEADESIRSRIIEGSKQYIQQETNIDYTWIGTNTFHRPSLAGCRALILLLREDVSFLETLDIKLWKRWAPIIIGTHSSGEEAYLEIIRYAYLNAPQESIDTLVTLIDTDSKKHGRVFALSRFDKCWDERLTSTLLRKSEDKALNPKCACQLLDVLIKRGVTEAMEVAQSLITFPVPSDQREYEKTIAAASLLAKYPEPHSWSFLWTLIQQNTQFGREVLEAASFGYVYGVCLNLGESQLADLYVWLVHQYPYSEDTDDSNAVMARFISNQDRLAGLRDSVLSQLREMGTIQACTEIERIITEFPEMVWLKKVLLSAQINVRRKTWQPMEPEAILQLVESYQPSIQKTLEKIMSEQSSPNFEGATFNAPVNLAPNYGNQAQYQSIQNTEQHFDILLSDFKQFVGNLQAQHPGINTPETAAQTIESEVRQLPKPRLQNFLSLKRLWNGGKKAGFELGEHFVESNVWGKGALAFLEGISEEI